MLFDWKGKQCKNNNDLKGIVSPHFPAAFSASYVRLLTLLAVSLNLIIVISSYWVS